MNMKKEIIAFDKSTSSYLNIPPEMAAVPHWGLWKLEPKPDGKKWDKIPCNADGGNIAHQSFNQTLEEALADYNPAVHAGIGYSFRETDPYVGFDYDYILTDAKEITEPEITDEIARLNSYTEVSQSGNGLHVICKATREPSMKPGKRKGCRETYFHDHYFAMTGNLWQTSPTQIREIESDLMREIYSKVDPPKLIHVRPQHTCSDTQRALSDREIVERIRDKADTRSLYNGSISGYDSPSEATLSLLNHLVFYSQERSQVDRIFRQSGLMRSKWDESRGGTTWGAQQIDKALADVRNTYDPHYANPGRNQPRQ